MYVNDIDNICENLYLTSQRVVSILSVVFDEKSWVDSVIGNQVWPASVVKEVKGDGLRFGSTLNESPEFIL